MRLYPGDRAPRASRVGHPKLAQAVRLAWRHVGHINGCRKNNSIRVLRPLRLRPFRSYFSYSWYEVADIKELSSMSADIHEQYTVYIKTSAHLN